MKEIIKSKKRKYYEVDDTIYKCETCGAEYDEPSYIGKCKICMEDVCPNCSGGEISKIYDRLVIRKNIEKSEISFVNYARSVTINSYDVHKKCAIQGMSRKKYIKKLKGIIDCFNDYIDCLNNNTFKGKKQKEQTLIDRCINRIQNLEKEKEQCYNKIKKYEDEIESDEYRLFKSLSKKQKQMLKLMNEE